MLGCSGGAHPLMVIELLRIGRSMQEENMKGSLE